MIILFVYFASLSRCATMDSWQGNSLVKRGAQTNTSNYRPMSEVPSNRSKASVLLCRRWRCGRGTNAMANLRQFRHGESKRSLFVSRRSRVRSPHRTTPSRNQRRLYTRGGLFVLTPLNGTGIYFGLPLGCVLPAIIMEFIIL